MRELEISTQYKKDLKRLLKQRAPFEELSAAIIVLQKDEVLNEKYKDHALIGNLKDYREIHITSDFLLIYKKIGTDILRLAAAGSHSELYRK